MSNSSSPFVVRIQRSGVLVISLMLALGTLILISNGLDPNSTTRGKPTPTAPPWKSTDGILELQLPDNWRVSSNTSTAPLSYAFTTSQNPSVILYVVFGFPTDLNISNVPPNATAEDLLRLALATQQPPAVVNPAQLGSLKGGIVNSTSSQTDAQTGLAQQTTRDLWLLNIDPGHIMLIQAVAPAADWSQFKPVFDRMLNDLKINTDQAIRALTANALSRTSTAAAVPTATAAVTGTPVATGTKAP